MDIKSNNKKKEESHMMSENIKNKPWSDRWILLLILGLGLGVLLLILGGQGEKKESRSASAEETAPDPEAYAQALEERIETLCSSVKGAGQVRVTVTLKGGYRTVYATDGRTSSAGVQSSTVLVGSGASEEAIFVCYENPEIAGVGIVCQGGDNDGVRRQIVSLVAATLDIGTNKIFVAAGHVS